MPAACYIISGARGNGKTLTAVGRALEKYIKRGRPVVANFDIYPWKAPRVVRHSNKTCATRIPDRPRPEDFEMLPKVCEVYEEDKFGVLLLDEMASWYNSRDWNNADRARITSWLTQSRKLGYDVFLIAQDENSIDKQLRDAMDDVHVYVKRTDKLRMPIIGTFVSWITGGEYDVRLPRYHVGRLEIDGHFIDERWYYKGQDIQDAYDTGAFNRPAMEFLPGKRVYEDEFKTERYPHAWHDMRAPFTFLSAWHMVGRYKTEIDWKATLTGLWFRWIPALAGASLIVYSNKKKTLPRRMSTPAPRQIQYG